MLRVAVAKALSLQLAELVRDEVAKMDAEPSVKEFVELLLREMLNELLAERG